MAFYVSLSSIARLFIRENAAVTCFKSRFSCHRAKVAHSHYAILQVRILQVLGGTGKDVSRLKGKEMQY